MGTAHKIDPEKKARKNKNQSTLPEILVFAMLFVQNKYVSKQTLVWVGVTTMRCVTESEHVMDTASKALWSTLIDFFSAVCVFVFVFVSVLVF